MQVINRDQLKLMNEQRHEDFVLLNVLSREQFLEDHIRTSINIPLEDAQFTEKVEQVAASKDRPIVVYCASEQCDASEKAAEKLEQAGFSQIHEYPGGTKDWHQAKSEEAVH